MKRVNTVNSEKFDAINMDFTDVREKFPKEKRELEKLTEELHAHECATSHFNGKFQSAVLTKVYYKDTWLERANQRKSEKEVLFRSQIES
jgi:hypothetical protein